MALNVEEHTIPQSLIGLDRPQDCKALESFAEYGAWNEPAREHCTAQLLEETPGRLWQGYHVWAGDDTKVHRDRATVWGTCTFHEYTARCPHRASTVRAHNWVVVGALRDRPEQPAWFVPVAGRLDCRRAQLPTTGNRADLPLTFWTQCARLVERVRQQAAAVVGAHLAVCDGGCAVKSVVRSLVCPGPDDGPRLEFVTRLRRDARLQRLPPRQRRRGQRGPMPHWGPRRPPPRQGGWWPGPWQEGQAFLQGRPRSVRWKEVVGLWRPLGADVVVKAVVAEVEGDSQRLTLVTSAVALTGLPVVTLFGARFRQEDGFRDLKQRLGWEECRAWTRWPILRTTLALFITLAVRRRLQVVLEASGAEGGWRRPPWNPHQSRPSVLDLERLRRRHATEIQHGLSAWLGPDEKTEGPEAAALAGRGSK